MNTMLSHALGEKKPDEVNHAAQAAVFLMLVAWIGLIMVWHYYKKDIRELLNLNEKFY